jgi:hypothetical protein
MSLLATDLFLEIRPGLFWVLGSRNAATNIDVLDSLEKESAQRHDGMSRDEVLSKCSNYAHDQALLGGTDVPEPDELLTDINALDEWRTKTQKRAGEVAKARKAGK